jgi:uncharacterized protein (DUF1778 family)
MATATQRKATSAHRARAKAQGLARVEVRVAEGDVALVRQFADGLRGERGTQLRAAVDEALNSKAAESALDMFQRLRLDEAAWATLAQALNEPHSNEIREIEW